MPISEMINMMDNSGPTKNQVSAKIPDISPSVMYARSFQGWAVRGSLAMRRNTGSSMTNAAVAHHAGGQRARPGEIRSRPPSSISYQPMMIVMTPQASPSQIDAVVARLETTGVHVRVIPGELTTAIGAIGDPEGVAELGLEGMPGVDRVVPISRPYKLASSELNHFEPTVVEVAGRRVGDPSTFTLIAGPCTVESEEQTLGVARA